MTITVSPTVDAQLALWETVFGRGRGYLGLLSLKAGTPAREQFHPYPAAANLALDWLRNEDRAGRDAYACAHLLTDRKRVKVRAAPLLALYGDLDGCPLPTGELRPSVVLESSPGRFHCWWTLTEAIEPARAELLNRRLAKAIGADESGHDLTQVLRVVDTRNHKPKYRAAYGAPPPVRLHDRNDRTFDPAELERRLPPAPATRGDHHDRGDAGDEAPITHHRNVALTSLGGRLRSCGLNEVELGDALASINQRRCRPPLAASEVRAVARSLRRYAPSLPVEAVDAAPDDPIFAGAKILHIRRDGDQGADPVFDEVDRVARLEHDLETAREEIRRLRQDNESLIANVVAREKLLGDFRRREIAIRELCASPIANPATKALAIGLVIEAEHNRRLEHVTTEPVRVCRAQAAEIGGIKALSTVTAQLKQLEGVGFLALTRIPRTKELYDKTTGRPYTIVTHELAVQLNPEYGVSASEQLSLLARTPARTNWGGKRAPHCPDHPDAKLLRRLHCSVCDRVIDEAAGPEWQDAIVVDSRLAGADEGPEWQDAIVVSQPPAPLTTGPECNLATPLLGKA